MPKKHLPASARSGQAASFETETACHVSRLGNAVREASRALAIGSISTQSEVQSLVQGRLVNWGIAFTVETTLPDPNDPNDTDYTVTVSTPMSEAAIIDFLGLFENRTLEASMTMREDA